MSLGVFAAVLAAALVHAGWNVLVKGAADKLAMTVSVALGAAIVAASILPFLPLPAPDSWPFLGASVLLQSVYYLLIARAYRIADMSLAYPLMRGAAPLVVALSGALVFGETLRSGQWMAIGLISAGIGALALGAFRQPLGAAGGITALCNAMIIASYTLVDASGVRLSGAPVAYALLLAVLTGVVTLALVFAGRARPRLDGRTLGLGLVGGAATTLSYGVALWAMTRAPVAPVAALRETSIVFALVLSHLVFGEKVGGRRIAAALLVMAGVGALRLF
ncbi:4-amino-4-deoxy-L-arabinose-phosphoundecaprenol flippase subunit ArnE [Pleomorphomonas sp. T1.2MG-36]|uniref:EamA family transporter n=1 Tax=Pleomorphomonas sp. T1.2MG-36 TaxID=3041167 RepID=UPI002477B865|nr:EamA family transporter [Pleomorphomonas sp. T1.2MG-36]CAI9412489.1 4-amino-4-deoxy-L-arabinose-phosphoundecaprenol flippase subunit ArnE [Pleomorphomonas sp. T1.2MG-36]